MQEITIREKDNEIQRVQLIKIINDEGKTSYNVMVRDKLQWEEENFPYKRVDFAVMKYLFYAGLGYEKREVITECRGIPAN